MTLRRFAACAPVHLFILRAAALLVPRQERTEWLEEWRSELWYVRAARRREATAFCLGAFPDALWLRRNSPSSISGRMFHLASPLPCVLLLAVLAAVSLFFAFRIPGVRGGESVIREQVILPHLLIMFITLLMLQVTISLNLGEYPANNHSLSRAKRLRRWIFFAIKITLILPIVFCGSLTLVSIGLEPIQGQVSLVGYILAFRWAIIDQRLRCPVCLRLLTNPIRIGQPSQTFLSWYGIELMCVRGHGLLHVPEFRTSCYSTQRWLYLDPSWNSLFP